MRTLERRMVLVWEKENEAGAEPRVKGLAGAMHREERREGKDAGPARLLGLRLFLAEPSPVGLQ